MKYKYRVCIYEDDKFYKWANIISDINLDWILREELFIKWTNQYIEYVKEETRFN